MVVPHDRSCACIRRADRAALKAVRVLDER
jgi:hypothetical protein